jgi:hypothetical protein
MKTPKTFKELFANTGIEPTTDESGNTHYNFKAVMKEEPKQELKEETTSEGFHRIYKETDYREFDFVSFKIGVEWQQERSYSEQEVELIANEMVNWTIDNIGNPNPQSGKKFDEIMSKFKKK